MKRRFDRRRRLASVDHRRPQEGDQILVRHVLVLSQETELAEAEAREAGPADGAQIGPAALDPQDVNRPPGQIRLAPLDRAVPPPGWVSVGSLPTRFDR